MNDEIESLLAKEDLTPATIGRRTAAFTIDELIVSGLVIAGAWEKLAAAKDMLTLLSYMDALVVWIMVLKIVYQAVFVSLYGATPGKMAMKIRVVSVDGLHLPDPVSSLKRAVMRIVSEAVFYLGFVWAMMDPSRQGWHDKFARTIVIHD